MVAYPLPDIWPRIVGRLSELRQRYPADWTEEEVYKALLDKRAFLFHSEESDSFCIVKTKIDKATNENVLFIWIACGENGAREQNLAMLMNLAKEIGAVRLEMVSPRRGYERAGWRIKETTYTMEV